MRKVAILSGLVVVCGTLGGGNSAAAAEPAAAKKIEAATVPAVVDQFLSSRADYRPGDLISVADVEPVLNALIERGLQHADNEELYDSILPDNNPLVQLFRTPQGKAFIRSVASEAGAYDRLERLSWLPTGRQLLGEMVAKPDGAAIFQSLQTPEGRKVLEKLLGNDVRIKNFDLPTGRIHTADEFSRRLHAALNKPRRAARAAAE